MESPHPEIEECLFKILPNQRRVLVLLKIRFLIPALIFVGLLSVFGQVQLLKTTLFHGSEVVVFGSYRTTTSTLVLHVVVFSLRFFTTTRRRPKLVLLRFFYHQSYGRGKPALSGIDHKESCDVCTHY